MRLHLYSSYQYAEVLLVPLTCYGQHSKTNETHCICICMVYSKISVDVLFLSELFIYSRYIAWWYTILIINRKLCPGVPITWDIFYLATNEANLGAFTNIVKSQSEPQRQLSSHRIQLLKKDHTEYMNSVFIYFIRVISWNSLITSRYFV